MKVWAVIENTTYGTDRIIGVCSSEEKAKLSVEISHRFDAMDFSVEEFELDEYLNENRGRLEAEINELKEDEKLLKRILELDP